LTREQVDTNAKTYLAQVYKILNRENTEVRYNSEWLGKLSGHDMIHLCAHYRLARMLEREDFRSRLEGNLPIAIHELLYPLLQAYDSVALEADVELGATEQKFNLLVGREIQREYGQTSQVALTMPILVGLDGQRKMSKSLGNYVGISEAPSDMFGKLMSLSDAMMWPYFDLVTDRTPEQIAALANEVKSGAKHPMDVKMALAKEIIAGFHGQAAADKAAGEFQRVFRDREAPDEIQEIKIIYGGGGAVSSLRQNGDIVDLVSFNISSTGNEKWTRFLHALGQVSSASEAERIIKGRGFEVNGQVVSDPSAKCDLNQPCVYSLKIGKKKFLRILVE
jgi:tyrosyl-tRNA synthetase